ncbi:MAG: hypothetical protein GY720_08125 [bacterium]|nr:hypothetical protein [bacterium]
MRQNPTTLSRQCLVLGALALALMASGAGAQQAGVFVTSTTIPTDQGVAFADAQCNSLASAAGLSGTYVAWLSTTTENAVDRLVATSGPFVRASPSAPAATIADDIADLTDSSLDNAIGFDESGNVPANNSVWTGTLADGTLELNRNCNDWAGGGFPDATHGQPAAADLDWTQADNRTNCGVGRRMYCFELPSVAVPAMSHWSKGALVGLFLAGLTATYLLRHRRQTAA